MTYHLLPTPPAVTFSTRASGPLRLQTAFRIAADARVDGVDLDLSGHLPLPPPERLASWSADRATPIRSIWMPRVLPGPLARWRREVTSAHAANVARATGVPTVIVDVRPGAEMRFSRAALAEVAEPIRMHVGPTARVAIALRARHLGGGREHLAQVVLLRRLAEEWDLDLALDLLGPINLGWEAEAAVTRLLPRLAVIRVGFMTPRRSVPGRPRLTARALAAALDGGFGGAVAVAPVLPAWQRGWSPAMVNACAAADQHVRARFAAMHEDRAFNSSQNPGLRY